ncbi:MAG: hypothetical protein J1F41_08600 [Lachnospiraceae bacterium]|nr:hypothetical protein [Lachnospiraceae bacterium]
MRKRQFIIGMLIFGVLCICAGCSSNQDSSYTLEQLDNLAQLEIYSAETNELIKVISDEETLYQYNQCSFDSDESVEHQAEFKNSVEGLKEEYYIESYKYPVSQFGSQELEKNITITVYENSNVIKMTVSEESIKGDSIPQAFLTFYYEMSDEDMDFYYSLVE